MNFFNYNILVAAFILFVFYSCYESSTPVKSDYDKYNRVIQVEMTPEFMAKNGIDIRAIK